MFAPGHEQPPPRIIGVDFKDIEANLNDVGENQLNIKKTMDKMNAQTGMNGTCKYNVANFCFCLVLMGTEFDMVGFCLSTVTFIGYGNWMLTTLIAVMVVAFAGPLLFVTCQGESARAGNAFEGDEEVSGVGVHASAFLQGLNRLMVPMNPHGGEMKLCHWVPLTRLYLLVKKHCTATDVDAVFRVNSVSSFSLGMATVSGLAITIAEQREWNLYLTISLGTWCFNWAITLMYYATPIPRLMANAATVKGVQRHFQGLMNHWGALLCQEATTQLAGTDMEEERLKKKQLKDAIKVRLITYVTDKYAGEALDDENKQQIVEFLKSTRDLDVRDFFLMVRNQVVHGVDMPE